MSASTPPPHLFSFHLGHRLLIVEIKDDSWVNSGSLHLRADEQICLRFDQMLQNCPLPVLYGISFLGTSMHIYSGNVATGNIILELIDDPDEDRIVPPKLLEGRWNIDVLSEVGAMRIQEVIEHIVHMNG